MTCPECHGTGTVRTALAQPVRGTRQTPRPCPECNGSGIASCCDTAGSGSHQPVKCHPLLFSDRVARRILAAPSNRAERRAHERIRQKVERLP